MMTNEYPRRPSHHHICTLTIYKKKSKWDLRLKGDTLAWGHRRVRLKKCWRAAAYNAALRRTEDDGVATWYTIAARIYLSEQLDGCEWCIGERASAFPALVYHLHPLSRTRARERYISLIICLHESAAEPLNYGRTMRAPRMRAGKVIRRDMGLFTPRGQRGWGDQRMIRSASISKRIFCWNMGLEDMSYGFWQGGCNGWRCGVYDVLLRVSFGYIMARRMGSVAWRK